MACELRWTAHGEPALEALASVVAEARSADALAPVTVVTPTPAVAVATRRALARRLGGTFGVGFTAVDGLAELLAARHLAAAGAAPAPPEALVAAVRVALRARPGAFEPIAAHRRTWEGVARAIAELDGVDAAALARVRSAGAVPSELVRLLDDVRELVGPLGSAAALRTAVDVAGQGGAAVAALGTVAVHLPNGLRPAELALLSAIGSHRPVVVLAGATGDDELDRSLAQQLAPLGVGGAAPTVAAGTVPTDIVSANDIDDEVRAAVRRLLALADTGTPLARMALVHPSGPPYGRIVADVLAGTGLPVAGPSVHRLAQTVPGRVLLGLLDVDRSRFGRQEVVDLWATGVVVDDEGRPVPAARFDERSRRLGVLAGAARWHEALDVDSARTDDPDRQAENARIAAAVSALDALCAERPTTWSQVAPWAATVLDRLCGPVRRRSWPEADLDADEAVRTALARLAALEAVEAEPSPEVLRETVRNALDAAAPRTGRAGTGLLVTTLDAPPLVPLDAVAVVGLVEGHAPRVGGADGLLGDELRRAVGLPAADDHQRAQRRALLATLGSAAHARIVTHARHDQRSGRALVPSRWLAQLVEQRTGHRPDTELLLAGEPVDGVTLVPSHGAALVDIARGRLAPLDVDELALAALVADGSLDRHPAAADPVLSAGAELVRARRSQDFTRFDGNLDGDGVDVTALGVLSPTSLETYARCPRRWFFTHALGLRPLDRPEEIHRIQPRDRGSLAHAALERFYEEAIAAGRVPAPGDTWSDAARDRLREIADECCAQAEARGITGHPRWWEHDRAEIHRVLQRVLDGDDQQRAAFGTVPVAVELTFGRDGAPPLAVDLGDGRTVLLAGQADRVDAGSGRVVVWDYKYSGTSEYRDLDTDEADGGDPLAGGTKVQLVAYAMAAAESAGLPDDVEVNAWYWFLKPPATNAIVGYPVGAQLRDRFRRVLRVLADGIAAGQFPARPGEHQYHRGNFEHCAWCEFDAICPRDRDEEWQRARLHPDLGPLVALVEDGTAALAGTGEGPMTEVLDHEARRRIAEAHGETLFVEAGAGSGKTSSLVSRVVALVLAGADVTQVAAITFTEAAAAELRARVRSALEAVEAGRPVRWVDDSPAARRLAGAALDRLDRATICTLHTFAQRLLLAAPIEARLPPAIDVHDDISSALRFEERWQRFEHSLLDDPAAAAVLRMALTLDIGSHDLQVLAATLGQNWDLVEEARLAGLVDQDLAVDVDPTVLRADDWIKALDDVVALRDACNDPQDKLATWIDATAAPLAAALEGARDDVHELVLVARGPHRRPHRNLGRKGCWADDGKARVIEQGCAVLDELQGAVDELTDQVLTRLGAELARYTLADAEARRREGRLEFHDLLVLARQVLRTRRSVRERFHDRYRHLLIDEFQDTDPIQVELAVRIAADPDHDPATPWDEVDVDDGRLFFVGDPKQSIYRFRRADIDLFSRTAARYTGGATSLRVNFRTVEPVLRFCNAVFESLIAAATESVDGAPDRIAQPPYVPLAPHRPALEADPGPPVLVLGDGTPHGSAADARLAESVDVAAALRRAHEDGWLVDPGGGARPCRWSDMAVLLPSRTTLSHLRSALDEAGVPYRLESGTLVYGTTEVADLLAVLRAIDDPGDAVAVVGALRSPAYGCGDDDLLRWVRAHGRIGYLGDAVRDAAVVAADPAADPVERGLADLRRRHRQAPFRSVPEIVDDVVGERRLMALCLAGGRPRDLWRLYRVVVEHARQFADGEDGGLRAFLRWADLQRDDKLRATGAVLPEADVDAVRILTIHGAKGLEFGITAVSGLSAQDPSNVRGATVRFRPTGGFDVRMRMGMETARYEAVRTLDEAMDTHERTRLLYVALTRARDHLVVSAHHTARAATRSHGGRLAARLAELGDELDDLAERWTVAGDEADAGAVVVDRSTSQPVLADCEVPSAAAWDARVAELERSRDAAARAASGVRSATAIARLLRDVDVDVDTDSDAVVDAGPAEPWRRGRGGTAVGSAVHAVLQHADLHDPTGADVADLARWQAGVVGLADDSVDVVAAKARAALASSLVARAAAAPVWRREVHVAVPVARLLGEDAGDGDAAGWGDADLVEGFVDLLFDDGAGGFVVVDHKTDDVGGAGGVERLLDRYAPQGAAYAALVEAATGRPVSEVHFLVLGIGGAVDVPVPDLAARVGEVRRALAEVAGS